MNSCKKTIFKNIIYSLQGHLRSFYDIPYISVRRNEEKKESVLFLLLFDQECYFNLARYFNVLHVEMFKANSKAYVAFVD